jgi:multisubunit Na+/H+ antiporter MnhC subunit
MEVLYKHRQIGWATIAIVTAVILVTIGWYIVARLMGCEGVLGRALIGVGIILTAVGVFFSTLTVRITNERMTFHFGPGLIRKTILLRNIASVYPVVNKWWYGLGIHLTPHGWLYNVSGLKAVEIHMWNGQVMRVGTDEPEALCHAIDHARTLNPSA